DLVAQEQFLLRVRDAIARANGLRGRIQQAMQQKGVAPPSAPGIGESPESARYSDPLQGLWARVVSAGGAYPEPMLIDQLQNIQRMVGSADQKVGQEAIKRFDDLLKELKTDKSRPCRDDEGDHGGSEGHGPANEATKLPKTNEADSPRVNTDHE